MSFHFISGNCKVDWRASRWTDGLDWEQETEVDENQADEGKQTTGEAEQTNTAGQTDDGAEAQETHGTTRCVQWSSSTVPLFYRAIFVSFQILSSIRLCAPSYFWFFWSNLYFLFCVCFDLFWRKGWWISIFDVITEMAKRAAEFKIQKRAERQKMKETTRKIKEIRGSDTPEPPSTSTDWQSQMYCLPNNILSCDPNASGQISQKWPVVCFKCLP